MSTSRTFRSGVSLSVASAILGTSVSSKRLETEIQGLTSGHKPLPDVTRVDPAPRDVFNVQNVLQQGGHAQHADAASRFVGQGMQFAPFTLTPSILHFSEVSRHLLLKQIQNAAHHGIVALEHLLEVIEVVVH